MKKHLSIALIALTSGLLYACNDADNGDDATGNGDTTQSVATDTTNANTQNTAPADSATVMFMTKAASGGMMEVQLGQLAQQQAQSQRVKDFGAMMVRDHGKANDELKSLASGKNVTLSDSLMAEHKHHVSELQNKKGAAFDRAYMSMMVKDHQKDIQEFEKASNNLSDGEIKAFATRTLPTLKAHLDSATAINKNRNR
jgi:putative membrane protein